MPPAGIGISPINPLGLEPPDTFQRSQPTRLSVSNVGQANPIQTNTLIRAPDPSVQTQGIENDLASPLPFEPPQTAPTPPEPPKQLQGVVDRGVGRQIDLLAF